ncbi:NHL repeat protein [compost metagenome]
MADSWNYSIRKIKLATREVTTFAGGNTPGAYGFSNGTGTSARFGSPSAIVFDAEGNLYVADGNNHAIRKITPAGVVTTLVGPYPTATSGYADGPFAVARFNHPRGLVFDATGDLYVAEALNHTIRKVQ